MERLDELIGKGSHVRILRVLHRASEALSGRDIERRTGLSNRGVMKALAALTAAGAVHVKTGSHAYAYTINRSYYLVERALRPAFEAEERFWEDAGKTIRRVVKPTPTAAVAVGPAVRHDDPRAPRLELVMLFESGARRIAAFRTMERLGAVLAERYGLTLAPALLDLRIMNRPEYEGLWKRVAREGLLLWGTLP